MATGSRASMGDDISSVIASGNGRVALRRVAWRRVAWRRVAWRRVLHVVGPKANERALTRSLLHPAARATKERAVVRR